MHIACCIDNKYVKFCITTLVSLFENNKNESFDIHIVGSSFSETTIGQLKEVVEKQYSQKLHIYSVQEDELLKDFQELNFRHFSIVSNLKLFLPQILPASLSKVLFLDCDLIVRKPILDLWNTDVTEKALACVEDMWSNKADYYQRLQYDPQYSYFNSGVLLINLDYWRTHDTTKQLLKFMNLHRERLIFIDQDILNGVLHNQKTLLPLTWNVQTGFFHVHRHIRREVWHELDEIICDPAIVHYTGGKKPWHFKSEHPYKNEFSHYLDMTDWKGERPQFMFGAWILMKLRPLAIALRLEKAGFKKFRKK